MKRILACVLVLAALASGGAALAAYPDVSDPAVGRAADALTMLGILDGLPDGRFGPELTLSRSQFCKMAVMTMADRGLVARYKSFTIFPDVLASHWAAGYVNLAAKGSKPIIAGYPSGAFGPEDAITFEQAVTILMRLLGYTDADVGMSWPDGYLATAAEVGLTAGLSLGGKDVMTRAQAALLFSNLLATEMKAGGYYVTQLSGTAEDGVILLSAADDDGNIVTSAGVYTPAVAFSAELVGERGILVLDKQGQALTLIPNETGSRTTVTVSSATYTYIQATDGTRYNIPAATPAYSGETASTYEKLWTDLAAGNRVSLYYNKAGKLAAVLRHAALGDTAMSAKSSFAEGANPFASLVTGTGAYQIVKNGSTVTAAALRRYDSAYFDAAARTLFVSDLRLSGSYQNVYPNTQTPVRITMGGVAFDLLPAAAADLSAYKLGASITLLLTWDGRVSGVVSGSVGSNAIGYAESCTADSATVKLLSGLTVTGKASLTEASAQKLAGQLVQVGSLFGERISITRLTGSVSGALNVTERRLGKTPLASAVRVFESVGTGAVGEIALEDITRASIPADAVSAAHTNDAGQVDVLLLDNATGDRYAYGFLRCTEGAENASLTVENGGGKAPVLTSASYKDGMPAGIAGTFDGRVASVVTLTKLTDVPRSAFQDGKLVYESHVFPLADGLDSVCYNQTTGKWVTLAEARAFAEKLTVCYDRPAEEGGKIRMVIVK